LEKALQIGSLSSLKIENMKLQHTAMISFADVGKKAPEPQAEEPAELKEVGFVAVSMGSGIKELFHSLGVDEVIEGGQTMTPSTEDILQAVERVRAKNVIVLPNNKNVIWAAQQAIELVTDKAVHVIPSKTVPQGLSAVISYMEDAELSENIAHMTEAMSNVRTGLVTYAVRATNHNGSEINEGDILCMQEDDIVHVAGDLQEGAKALADIIMQDGGEVFSVFYGQDVTHEMAEDIQDYVCNKYPACELEVYDGSQPLYYYILSAE
jgi:dihydroxyacetone kinase-like predicted kinase